MRSTSGIWTKNSRVSREEHVVQVHVGGDCGLRYGRITINELTVAQVERAAAFDGNTAPEIEETQVLERDRRTRRERERYALPIEAAWLTAGVQVIVAVVVVVHTGKDSRTIG